MKSRDILVLFLIAFILFITFKATPERSDEVIACTADAMLCPDGSYVGRSGPNCEFVCPNIIENITANIGVSILNGGVYITPLKVLSDSRCPEDVQCIWAGEVRILARISDGKEVREVTLVESTTFEFQGKIIELTGVRPSAHSKKIIKSNDYLFEFSVK